MDGFKARLRYSLRARLTLWLSVAILAVAFAAGGFSYASAHREANELQDGILLQVSALLAAQPGVPRAWIAGAAEADAESRLLVRVLPNGGPAGAPGSAAGLAERPDGLQSLALGGVAYRGVMTTLESGERVLVAQKRALRDEIAADGALHATMPLLLLAPVLLLVVADVVRKMLAPVARLARSVEQRDDTNLQPVQITGLPLEVRPFAVAINGLLARVADAIAHQRRFVADAAHELRTPMTALTLQAERLSGLIGEAAAQRELQSLRGGIGRARNLLDMLLNLAAAQARVDTVADPVSVHGVYRRVLEDLMPQAQQRDIDIGVAEQADVALAMDPHELAIVVRNLADNAIRHSPPGGRVDLSLEQIGDHCRLMIEDNGPGIARSERARVLEAFYRVDAGSSSGSGLGLAIVKAIVERYRGTLVLGEAKASPSGLRVIVTVPMHRGTRVADTGTAT